MEDSREMQVEIIPITFQEDQEETINRDRPDIE